RHTRFSRDWSSDVCSSDLGRPSTPDQKEIQRRGETPRRSASKSTGLTRLTQFPESQYRVACPFAALYSGGVVRYHRSPRSQGFRSEERRVGKEGRARWSR